jgi:hypothetical protein
VCYKEFKLIEKSLRDEYMERRRGLIKKYFNEGKNAN